MSARDGAARRPSPLGFGRGILGGMEDGRMAATRVQSAYDHRLRELVRATGDVALATRLGVPRSTAAGWLRGARTRVVAVLRRRVCRLQALLRVLLAVVRASPRCARPPGSGALRRTARGPAPRARRSRRTTPPPRDGGRASRRSPCPSRVTPQRSLGQRARPPSRHRPGRREGPARPGKGWREAPAPGLAAEHTPP